MEQLNDSNDAWDTVITKSTTRREKRKKNAEKRQMLAKERDLKYLKSQRVFRLHGLTSDKIKGILQSHPQITNDTLFIFSTARCVGHLVAVSSSHGDQKCLQCSWVSKDYNDVHCCCSESLKAALPMNFYLGCDGPLDEYLEFFGSD